ncbi:hypothetical protein [Anaerocolumna sp.]|uniref:hypothetical protein n=1 Tax=Anaerocolumna sp. TaxID=2041569 RepID=UPI0028ACBB37|nr:hypothetical protein [Anaerocolumna sp.]
MSAEKDTSKIKKDNGYKKYFWIYIGITFGLSWGMSFLYVIFYDMLSPYVGTLDLSNPFVIVSLNSPSIAGVFIYFIYGGGKGMLKFLKRLIPNKKECIWFLILLGISVVFYVCIHYGSILFGIPLPEVTMNTKERVIMLLKNIYEETGLLGGALGWYGFLLPYLQRKTKSSIKAGLATGFIFGLFVLPGYLFSSFETATAYPFYVLQLMFFSVFIAFVFNKTRGNVLFFVFTFWLVASGSKLQFYNFIVSVQILEMVFFIIAAGAIYLWYRKTKGEDLNTSDLCCFPEFIEK